MTSKRRRWVRWTTGSSLLLLVLAVVSLVQVYPLLVSTFDPESNYVVKIEPEEEKGFLLE